MREFNGHVASTGEKIVKQNEKDVRFVIALIKLKEGDAFLRGSMRITGKDFVFWEYGREFSITVNQTKFENIDTENQIQIKVRLAGVNEIKDGDRFVFESIEKFDNSLKFFGGKLILGLEENAYIYKDEYYVLIERSSIRQSLIDEYNSKTDKNQTKIDEFADKKEDKKE